MSKRQVDGFIAECERHAGEARSHRLVAVTKRVESDDIGGLDLQHELLEFILREQSAVLTWLDGCRSDGRGRRRRRALHLAQPGLEAKALVELALFRGVAVQVKVMNRYGKRNVAFDGEELTRLRQPVAHLAQVLAGEPGDLIGVREHTFERAVLLDPLARGLGADL